MTTQPMISVAGIRGIIGDSLHPENFLRYVLAFGTLIDGGPVVLGNDSRLSRDMLRHLAFAALSSCGCEVIDLGLVPTPTVGLMVNEMKAAGGIAITASHNPSQWNAYKFFSEKGTFLNPEQNARLLEIAESGEFRRVAYRRLGRVQEVSNGIEKHIQKVLRAIDSEPVKRKKYKVVVDCVNGVGGLIAKPLLENFGCEVHLIDADVNAEFPRNPEPLPENLLKLGAAVVEHHAHLGFAIDPDADRLALVDETGRAIGEERTLTLAAASALRHKKGPIVANLSTTRALDDVAAAAGVECHRTRIGEAHVVGKIHEVQALIGGEGNGGVIYPPVHSGRDAATGMALLLTALAEHGGTMSELNATVPDYHMVKAKVTLTNTDFDKVKAKMRLEFADAKAHITDDGMKVVFEDSWVHVRPSGTEPILRVFAEAPSMEAAHDLVQRVRIEVLGRRPDPTVFV